MRTVGMVKKKEEAGYKKGVTQMSKAELVAYAAEIGLKLKDPAASNKALVAEIKAFEEAEEAPATPVIEEAEASEDGEADEFVGEDD